MKTLKREQTLPISIDAAWEFFSSPMNLCRITPDWLGFEVRSGGKTPMYAGQIITYTIKPALGITARWVTEITHVREPSFFVDEQRIGPYAFWHHQHRFEDVGGATRAYDEVNYALPLGMVGERLAGWWIEQRLESIFDYRRKALEGMFGSVG